MPSFPMVFSLCVVRMPQCGTFRIHLIQSYVTTANNDKTDSKVFLFCCR
jgi:hypothetical protein